MENNSYEIPIKETKLRKLLNYYDKHSYRVWFVILCIIVIISIVIGFSFQNWFISAFSTLTTIKPVNTATFKDKFDSFPNSTKELNYYKGLSNSEKEKYLALSSIKKMKIIDTL